MLKNYQKWTDFFHTQVQVVMNQCCGAGAGAGTFAGAGAGAVTLIQFLAPAPAPCYKLGILK